MQNTTESGGQETSRGAAAPAVALRVSSHGITDRGRQRETNEDQFLIAEVRRALRVQQSSLAQPESLLGDALGQLLVVADGMGGHRGGEVASALAVASVENLLLNTIRAWSGASRSRSPEPDTGLAANGEPSLGLTGEGVLGELQEALRLTDQWIADAAGREPALHGMGTTLTMAYLTGRAVYLAHAGDSRCYLLHDGHLVRLTRDHTLVASLVRDGVLTPEAAARHEMRNVVTNAVGGGVTGVEPDVHEHAVTAGDVLLLCTDGLTGLVSDEELAAVLARPLSPEETCHLLVDEANRRGGDDNVTTVVARLET
jgi:protein phosphatase